MFRRAIALLMLSASPLVAQKAGPVFSNGMAQIVPAFQDTSTWIREHLWVETNLDSDRDGRKDRVHVDVTRPGQTENEGLKVPVLYGSSPYFAQTAPFLGWNVQHEIGAEPPMRGRPNRSVPYNGTRTRISTALVNWVPRGFGVIHSEAPGTGQSDGCPTIGGVDERMPMKFVIDWLNGRAKGYTQRVGGEEVKATWTTGKVAMMGTSYEGTLPLAAATTGVQGLELVVPVAPNTSYYHYYRTNGLVRSPGGYLGEDVDALYDFVASGDTAMRAKCDAIWRDGIFRGSKGQDRITGDFNDFWLDRDLLPFVKNIKAKVLLVHGFNDYNVVPEHSVRIYDEMKARGMNPSIILHQGGHGGQVPPDMLNRWFSHYLYGVDNGAEKDPPVWIHQDAGAQTPEPLMASRLATVPPPADAGRAGGAGAPGGGRGAGRGGPAVPPTPFASFPVPGTATVKLYPTVSAYSVGALSFNPVSSGTEKFIDDVAMSGAANASAEKSANRLLWATPTLTDTVHLSGTPKITLRIASSKPAANLSVWLVMLPYDSANAGSSAARGLITRGWADIQNYKSLTKGGPYMAKTPGEKLVPGKFYDVTFDLQPDDEFIPAGKRLAVMVMSSDRQFTLWPPAGTELTVDLTKSYFSLPIVGGKGALEKAGMK